jgi:lipoprotein-releasing system ATP-binding protein
LPEFTAVENCAMPALIAGVARPDAEARARRLLDRVGLSKRLTHRPGELSGGEQQRVALARALVMEPRVLLADEPTGNLDTHTGEAMHRLMVELNNERGMTLIVVTHNPDFADRLPRRVHMVDGRIDTETAAA